MGTAAAIAEADWAEHAKLNASSALCRHRPRMPMSPSRAGDCRPAAAAQQPGIAATRWCGEVWPQRRGRRPCPFQAINGPSSTPQPALALEDRCVVSENPHAGVEHADPLADACDFLPEQAQRSGQRRLLALTTHPWVMGQPHRIKHLQHVFANWPTMRG